jgi:hypothetical protein
VVRSAPTYKKPTTTRLTKHYVILQKEEFVLITKDNSLLPAFYTWFILDVLVIVHLYASTSTTLTSLIMGREKRTLHRVANATTAPSCLLAVMRVNGSIEG